MLIATTPLIVTGAFGPGLPAPRVAAALALGMRAGGLAQPEVCALPTGLDGGGAMRARLQELLPDRRMRDARALILAERVLEEATLAGSAAFELATRARQAGVPCYAVAGENRLSPFDARILDLQAVLTASSTRALTAAGRKLARLIQ
jgi:glycerate kinase